MLFILQKLDRIRTCNYSIICQIYLYLSISLHFKVPYLFLTSCFYASFVEFPMYIPYAVPIQCLTPCSSVLTFITLYIIFWLYSSVTHLTTFLKHVTITVIIIARRSWLCKHVRDVIRSIIPTKRWSIKQKYSGYT